MISDIKCLLGKKDKEIVEQNARVLLFNFALLYIVSLFEQKVAPRYSNDRTEMAVVGFWRNRMKA